MWNDRAIRVVGACVAIVMEGWQVTVCWEGLRMFSGQLAWGTK